MSSTNDLERAHDEILDSYLTQEMARASRLETQLSLVLFDLSEWNADMPDCRQRLARALAKHCRSIDVWLNDREGAWVILPGTPAASALALVQRVGHAVDGNFDLFAGIADTCSTSVFNAASLRASAERALAQARRGPSGDNYVIAPAVTPVPELADARPGLRDADLFPLPTDWVERLFPCPESGETVRCSFERRPTGWEVHACTAAAGRPPACSRKCVEAQRQGVSLAAAWSASHSEPPET